MARPAAARPGVKRLFVASLLPANAEQAPLSSADRHHLIKVMRLGEGDELELADGSGWLFRGRLVVGSGRQAFVQIMERVELVAAPAPRLRLLFGVARGERTDFVLQKATELGVDELVPVVCERSVARPKQADEKRSRWSEIVRQAARQCERWTCPSVAAPQHLSAALAALATDHPRLVATQGGEMCAHDFEWQEAAPAELSVLVGPEGGLSPLEVAACLEHGFRPVGLGPLVLRTETATTALLAILNFATGRWRRWAVSTALEAEAVPASPGG